VALEFINCLKILHINFIPYNGELSMDSLCSPSCTVRSHMDSTKYQKTIQQKGCQEMGILSSVLVVHTSYSNDGGGGEKVLWCIIKALAEETND
jgi:hypothetical protein